MASDQINLFLSVTDVFPSLGSDHDTLKAVLSHLSRTDTLFWCARLNLVIADPDVDHVTKQEFGINQFFSPEEIHRINTFTRDNGGAQKITVFFRGQLLELIRWVSLYCSDHPDDGISFEDHTIRQRFAQAALIASDIWSRRVFGKNRFSLEGGMDKARERSLGAIRKSIEGQQEAPNLSKSLGRGWALFSNYFPKFNQSFNIVFQSSTNISVEDYFICFGATITSFMNPKNNTGVFNTNTIGIQTQYSPILLHYIDLESQTPDELRKALWGDVLDVDTVQDNKDYDYQPLRQKPILRTNDGRAIIIDPIFYSDKASIGPIFLLLKKYRLTAISDFGKAFENYVCDMLERMFPDVSQANDKRIQCNIMDADIEGTQFEIDACLNDVSEAVLFEIKSGLIREDTILAEDHETYLQHLKNKYVWSDGNKGVGVGQLAKSINIIASKKWLGRNQEFSKVRLVYPVLLVHDSLLAAPVYGNFLALEFKKLLYPDMELSSGELLKADLRVAPLIIMTVDDLENLETSIEHFGFRELLFAYSQRVPDRMMSLHNFLAFSEFSKHLYHNRKIAEAGLEILDKVKEKVFC